jgi:hypothetical protein
LQKTSEVPILVVIWDFGLRIWDMRYEM